MHFAQGTPNNADMESSLGIAPSTNQVLNMNKYAESLHKLPKFKRILRKIELNSSVDTVTIYYSAPFNGKEVVCGKTHVMISIYPLSRIF